MTTRGRDGTPRELRVCRAIRRLAEGASAGQVAADLRLRPATLATWQQDADFSALLGCVRAAREVQHTLRALDSLLPGALSALRRALEGDDDRIAVQAAREVLQRVGQIQRHSSEHTVRVEYATPEGTPVSASHWAERHPASSSALQGSGVRAALREDGDGQDPGG